MMTRVIGYLVAVVDNWNEKRYHRRCCFRETFGKPNNLVNHIGLFSWTLHAVSILTNGHMD